MYQVVLFGLSNLILVNAFQLTVLHTNDLHSRFDEVTSRGGDCENGHKCYGGVARIKYVVDQYKKKEDNLIFLNAGDFFQVRILTLLCILSHIQNKYLSKRAFGPDLFACTNKSVKVQGMKFP